MPEDKKSDVKQASVVRVATEYGEGFELPDGKVVNLQQFLVEMYNQIEVIKKAVA